MLDYMIWPWFERRPVISMFFPDAANWEDIKKNTATIVSFKLFAQVLNGKRPKIILVHFSFVFLNFRISGMNGCNLTQQCKSISYHRKFTISTVRD